MSSKNEYSSIRKREEGGSEDGCRRKSRKEKV